VILSSYRKENEDVIEVLFYPIIGKKNEATGKS
jgi:hypothetical protein